jgi:hypothetical protein
MLIIIIIIIIIIQCYITSLTYRIVVQIYIALTFEYFEKEYVYHNYLHIHNYNTKAMCFLR